jgi:DNA-binding MarR family transcriptional regulator
MGKTRKNQKDTAKKLENVAECLISVFPVYHKQMMKINKDRKGKCLYGSHYAIMALLLKYGPLATSEIGKRLSISKPNMTALIDRLIEDKFVERLPNQIDRRIIKINVTLSGKKYLLASKTKAVANLKKGLSSLNEPDLNVLYSSFTNIKNILQKVNEL